VETEFGEGSEVGDAGVTFFVWCMEESSGVDIAGATDVATGEVV
jgi:hypothetical protein